MKTTKNFAAWLPGVGKSLTIGPADIPEPSENELLIEVKAVAAQPAEFKIQEGILPIPLTYPTILGVIFSGVVVKVGKGVTRFQAGDRITTNGAQSLRDDARFGAYQRYALTTQALTAKIGDLAFEVASTAASIYGPICALVFHLHLDRPSSNPNPANITKKVLIWGASSTFGAFAVQVAAEAGYTVVGVASAHNEQLVKSLGATHFVDRKSSSIVQDLIDLGPFHTVLAAADAAPDQIVIGDVLASQGGGVFLSTMGVRNGVQLPDGVRGFFAQFLDEYLKPENKEFTEWVWWDYLENGLSSGKIKLLPINILGGLSKVQDAWNLLKENKVSGQKLIIKPGEDD